MRSRGGRRLSDPGAVRDGRWERGDDSSEDGEEDGQSAGAELEGSLSADLVEGEEDEEEVRDGAGWSGCIQLLPELRERNARTQRHRRYPAPTTASIQ